MDACTQGKTDESKLKGCASDFAKKAIAKTMGREEDDVKEEEVTKFVKEATVERVKKEMGACVQNAADKAARLKCTTEKAKKAMASGLGKLEKDVDEAEVSKFLKRAALSSVEEEMDACTQGKTDESKLKGCASDFAKKAIAKTMGREEDDVKEEEVTKFVKEATVERV